jgi:iron(III) transport system substrate-binding protein
MSGFMTKPLCGALAATLLAVVSVSVQAQTLEELKVAAQKDGIVVFRTGPTDTRAYRQVQAELEKMLGIKIQLITGSSSQQVPNEIAARQAGKPTADIWLGGSSPIINRFVPAGAVQPLEPLLVLPEVTDPSKWLAGKLPWASEWTLAFAARADRGQITYNKGLVDPKEFTSYWDLLQPKWRGKIVMRDPRSDGVEGDRGFMYAKLGKTFFTRLFAEMKPAIAPDARTMVDWVARGRYAICIMGCSASAEMAESQGLPITAALPQVLKEGYPMLMGGNGLTAMADPPHPAAQKYYINWFLSREGQIFYQKLTDNFSLRNDIPREGVSPANLVKAEEIAYLWYGWEDTESSREAQQWLREIMPEHGYQ